MDPPSRTFDLRRASTQLYRRWVKWYAIGTGAFIFLPSFPYIIPVSLDILSGRVPSTDTLAVYSAIIGAAYPSAAFALIAGIVGGAPRPIRMTLANDTIWLESPTGRRSRIDLTDPRL
jgi:fucose permease